MEKPITIERVYCAPIKKVWKALTDNADLQQWYFKLPEFKAEVGFEFRFTGGKDEQHQYLHICVVTEAVPEEKLKYSWRYDGYEGISYVTFELFSEGNNTRLKLTHEGIESFPKTNSDFDKNNFNEGWTFIVGTAFKDFVEKA